MVGRLGGWRGEQGELDLEPTRRWITTLEAIYEAAYICNDDIRGSVGIAGTGSGRKSTTERGVKFRSRAKKRRLSHGRRLETKEVDRWNHGFAVSPSPEILMATLHPNTTVRRNHTFNETDPFDYAP